MGRQVEFYMTEADEKEFMDFVRTTGKIEILPYFMKVTSERLASLPSLGFDPQSDCVFLYNSLVPGELIIKPLDFPVLPEKPGRWSVDDSNSPVIEFSRSEQRGNGLMEGRIYATFKLVRWDLNSLVPKDPAFAKWYDKIARWIKRRYTRIESLTYASPRALKFKEEGGVFKRMGEGW